MPNQLPEIVWRRGIDLNPLDVTNDDDMRWLEACIWPDQVHRIERLRRQSMWPGRTLQRSSGPTC
jgi:hypothetical protein